MEAANHISSIKPFKILIVDDEAYIIDFLKEALLFWGYEVISAFTAQEAFEIIKTNDITLLITDIKMEASDSGLRLVEDARALFPNLLIILVTGSFVDDNTMKFCETNSVSFLQKPIRANELKILINNTFCQHQKEIELKSDIEAAKKIIENTFPKKNPENSKIDIFSIYKPVYDIGGDFYDFIDLGGGKLLFYLCDVQGHGVHAAIFANTIRIFLRAFAETTEGLDNIVKRLNASMCAETHSNLMATAFFACYDTESGTLSFVNAGHEPPLLYRAAAGSFERLESGGTIIGIFESAEYLMHKTVLEPDDILFLYTDGVCDNYNINFQNFSIDKINEIITANKNENSQHIGRQILNRIQKHLGGNPQHDDLAFILLKINACRADNENHNDKDSVKFYGN
ncbi:MAG: Phosphoserine phosphatase RsbU [bacterium ADurb.Bin243]|nr:MAG: Phosphoserine phosphatase RsbU [bacterium ADurb.Bin243]